MEESEREYGRDAEEENVVNFLQIEAALLCVVPHSFQKHLLVVVVVVVVISLSSVKS